MPPTPQLAATILLLRDDPFRVLMVTRAAKGSFASALVFPGGTVDADDRADHWRARCSGAEGLDEGARALRIAALRETWEEVGLFVQHHGAVSRQGVIPGRTRFDTALDAVGGMLPLSELVDFSHWITPETAPRRFDTRFFLCPAPEGQEPICHEGEVYRAEWIEPLRALAMGKAGERNIVLPTRLNLERLAESHCVESAIAAARARHIVPILPWLEENAQGRFIVIPQEAGYGATHFARN